MKCIECRQYRKKDSYCKWHKAYISYSLVNRDKPCAIEFNDKEK